MDEYVKLIKCILKNLKNKEFDYVVRYILNTIFNEYYDNRNNCKYCINNLYKQFDLIKYKFIKKKYGIVKNQNLIYTFSKYSKRNYIKRLIKSNEYFYIDENEDINRIIDNILEVNPSNYKKYIDNMYLDQFLDRIEHAVDEANLEVDLINNQEEDDFEIILNRIVCYFPPCLNKIIGSDNYCSIHNKDSI